MGNRWNNAQVAEKRFWDNFLNLDYKNRPEWNDYYNLIKKYTPFNKKTKILDVGCGGYGILNGLNCGERYGIEPLMDFFLAKLKMSDKIKWIKGKGENLPFDDSFFDIIFCINVLDHVETPLETLDEINRCLKEKQIFFMTLNCYGRPVALLRKFAERIGFGDPGHPHSYTINEMKNLLRSKNFTVLKIIDAKELPSMATTSRYETKTPFLKKMIRIYNERGVTTLLKRLMIFPLYSILTFFSRNFPDHVFICTK